MAAHMVVSMQASRSSPGLLGVPVRQTLHHRGEDKIGSVAGVTNEDTYVPRALWTETFDSPMKTRSMNFNAQEFIAEENARQAANLQKKDLLRQSHVRSMDQRKTLRNNETAELREFARTFESSEEIARRKTMSAQNLKDNNRKLREGLDEQMRHLRRRAQEQRLEEAHEGAQLKLRVAQQAAEETEARHRRKDAHKKHAEDTLRVIDAKRKAAKDSKEKASLLAKQEYTRGMMSDQDRNVARKDRLNEIDKRAAHHREIFLGTAAKAESQRTQQENERIERDEHMHAERMERHYHDREVGREWQRQDFIAMLGTQMDATSKRKELVSLQKQVERDAVNHSLAQFINMDLQKQASKKADEVQLQQDLISMIAAKQQREMLENPHVRRALAPGPAMSPPAICGQGGTILNGLDQSLDAPRHLEKPLGKARAKPWVDLSKAHFGGGVGVYSGEGGYTRAALLATGGTDKRILAKSSKLISQHHRMDAPWHEGLTPAQMKSGRCVAAQREAASAWAHAECPP